MKRIISGVLSLVTVLSLYACQPVSVKETVANTGNKALEKELVKVNTPGESKPADRRWQEELETKDGAVRIHVDAEINLPDQQQLSVVSCVPHYFTSDEVKHAVGLFYGDAKLYDNSLSDKDWLESEISKQKENLEYLKENGGYPQENGGEGPQPAPVEDPEEEIIWLEDMIAQLEADYEIVSEGESVITEIEMKGNGSGGESVSIRDGQTPPMEFYAYNDGENRENVIGAAMEYDVAGHDFSFTRPLQDTEQLDIAMPREEAERAALQTASDCGISECEIVAAGSTTADGQETYVFTLSRLIGGVPCVPVGDFVGTKAFGGDSGEDQEPWRQEKIQVMVNDKGVVGFKWECPPEMLETVNDDVAVKTYEEIIEIARMILPPQAEAEAPVDEKHREVTICEVTLSMMRVANTGSDNLYYYLPVWDFIGYHGESKDTGITEDHPAATRSFLTLNAVDGSVIDRGLGY
ncbi:DUF6034 family protein [Ruminococcus sp. OA3]|uniref:DUF6034 family protein n=1 Tax=Ruminococcus sp. OA3 TaxID=2914164 RepID=UPI001F06783D|nr:DUF6034 family protein [Ruminococcus sp. OA3]MCH1981930.1 DUF6034 family protein [Ruminococcus sp. OA3]